MYINIQAARAETLPASTYNVVTLRAVERFESILPVATRLVKPAGRLALLIGSSQLDQAKEILPNFLWPDEWPLPGSTSRVLAVAVEHVPK